MNPNSYYIQALANISSIDLAARYWKKDVWSMEANISALYQTLNRDSFYFNNLAKDFSFYGDIIFLPGFVHYDDTGNTNSMLPISFVVGSKYYFLKNENILLSLKEYVGAEFIPDYNYMTFPNVMIYGALGNINYNVNKDITLGFSAGFSELNLRSVFLEGGLDYHWPGLDTILAVTLDGNYKTAKLGFIYPVTKDFNILWGGNYTFEYNGWNICAGVDFDHVNVFSTDSRVGCAISFNMIGGFNATFTWNFDFPKIPAAKTVVILETNNTTNDSTNKAAQPVTR